MMWRANYSDGTYLESDSIPNAYANIDREQMESFSVYDDDTTLLVAVNIPKGKRLVYRKRHILKPLIGYEALVLLVTVESGDRSEVDVHAIYGDSNETVLITREGYGDEPFSEPPLMDFEVVR